jgi:hypothetical protein
MKKETNLKDRECVGQHKFVFSHYERNIFLHKHAYFVCKKCGLLRIGGRLDESRRLTDD